MGEKRKEKKKRKRWPVFLAAAGIVLLSMTASAAAGYLILDSRGAKKLEKKQSASPDRMGEQAESFDGGENLSAGTLRYQGKTYTYKQDILTFLFMGVDTEGAVAALEEGQRGGQADALFLTALDRKSGRISLIGINRDTMTQIKRYDINGLYAGEAQEQIALAYAYGDGQEKSCENTVEAVSKLFYGLPIHGYCAVRMDAVKVLNDAVGGVDVTIPESAAMADMEIDGARYKTGWQTGQQVHLMGNDAYTFIRYRDVETAESAEARLERQKAYLQALWTQAKAAIRNDLTLPVTLYNKLKPYMVTDISAEEAVHLAGEIISYDFGGGNVYGLTGEVRMGETFEEFYPDETALYELILQIFYEQE